MHKPPWQYIGENIAAFPIHDLFYCDYFDEESGDKSIGLPAAGISMNLDKENTIQSVFLYAEYAETDYGRYGGTLPFDLRFEMSRNDVRTLLGEPDFSRGPCYNEFLKRTSNPLDRYYRDEKSYAFEYLPTLSSINIICIFRKIID
ncbi:hypothetical protein HW511_10355 [Asaia siamensis]|uniref:Uncharacterized protein n=1 Tax=Asaia siamensis TaxID=110479 RepID=A0ABQ1M058_9PROT|nr:hypothetical protein [Asaia siamensis]GBR10144.1 hypothetical protein AA0323_2716 [Asaia siamensis NRIC 0323]GGC32739.1 hypothetical protein GCM10007207_17790 [Asaia siamensis]